MKKVETIALIAPSGNIKDFEALKSKIKILENKFKIKKFYNENAANGYLSDSDENRARYFENAFLDDEVDLVLSVRGGYGAIRTVEKINFDLIKNSDKFYAGSSDATILLAALSEKTCVKCFHSLMVTNGFVENLSKNIEIIENSAFNLMYEKLYKNNQNAKGILWGGNLSSLVSMFSGETFIPDEDIILFLEDLNEPLYKIDKMLFEIYRNQKLREKIKGIIFGDFYFEKNEIINLLIEYSKMFDVPSFLAFDITHKTNNVTLPFKKFVEL